MIRGRGLGLVTSHNARLATARPVSGFVGATADRPGAHHDALLGAPPGRLRINTRALSGG